MTILAPNAYYIQQQLVSAIRGNGERSLSIELPDGRTDSVALLDGEWAIPTLEGIETIANDREFNQKYLPVEGMPSVYVERSAPVRLQQPVDGDEAEVFNEHWMRADQEGNPLAPTFAPIGVQASMLGMAKNRESAREHLSVLRVFRDQIKAPIWDPSVQADATQFDLMSAMFDEGDVVETKDKKEVNVEEVLGDIEEFSQQANIRPLPWIGLGEFPLSKVPQIKQLQKMLLGCYTDISVEDIQMTMHPASEDQTALEVFVDTLKNNGEKRKIEKQPDFSNLAPGYEPWTELYAANGVEFLVVEDFTGKYIYAWPDSGPRNTPKI